MKMTTTKRAAGAVAAVKECMTVQPVASATALVLSLQTKKMTIMNNWPFPTHPPTPWTTKQIKEYAQQQRAQLPEAPL